MAVGARRSGERCRQQRVDRATLRRCRWRRRRRWPVAWPAASGHWPGDERRLDAAVARRAMSPRTGGSTIRLRRMSRHQDDVHQQAAQRTGRWRHTADVTGGERGTGQLLREHETWPTSDKSDRVDDPLPVIRPGVSASHGRGEAVCPGQTRRPVVSQRRPQTARREQTGGRNATPRRGQRRISDITDGCTVPVSRSQGHVSCGHQTSSQLGHWWAGAAPAIASCSRQLRATTRHASPAELSVSRQPTARFGDMGVDTPTAHHDAFWSCGICYNEAGEFPVKRKTFLPRHSCVWTKTNWNVIFKFPFNISLYLTCHVVMSPTSCDVHTYIGFILLHINKILFTIHN